MSLVFLLVTAGVLMLRRTRPTSARPYRVPGGPTLPVLAALACAGMLIVGLTEAWQTADGKLPVEWVFLAVWGTLGASFWLFAKRTRNSIEANERRWLILEKQES